MTEKKKGVRRIQPLNREQKASDQPLRSADDAPVIGRIHPPKKEAAEAIRSPRGKRPDSRPRTNVRPRPQNTETKKAETPRASGRPAQAGKPIQTPITADSKHPLARQTPAAASEETKRPSRTGEPRRAPAGNRRSRPVPADKTAARTKRPSPLPRRRNSRNSSSKPAIKAYFLGGLNEIGKNFTLFECGDDMIIVDCGMAFPGDDMLGIDCVIPDFTFLEKISDKIRGIVITHGHEDHIGALPYLLKKFNVPLYATALTVGLIRSKLKEHGSIQRTARLNVRNAGDRIKLGCMDVELIHVNHSVADAVAVAIHSPAGIVVHTGDFKIDYTPAEGQMIDLARFAELGREGVLALLMDSTNAERAGYTPTEQKVNSSLQALFQRAEGKRIIVATFASNISRVQQIINCAQQTNRKVALSGRSMLNVMGIATQLGYLNVPEGMLVDLNTIGRYDKGEVVLITTGSQGEPMSALTRMAFSDHRQVEVGSGDFIILSARPIPGNEKMVGSVVDELMRKECTVIYESIYDVHVSGHACQEELKIIQALVKPKYFIPVHGEQKHLRKNADVAVSLGMSPDNIFIGTIGNVLELHEDYMKPLEDVPAGAVMVDGLGVGDVGSVVLRDRKHLGEDGIIIAVCAIDSKTGHVASRPDIVSRGFVYVRESEKLMDEARKLVYNTLEACAKGGTRDWNGLKTSVKDELSHFLYRKTKRNPMVLPIIMEVNR